VPVFSDINLAIERGGRIGLVGPNGCGKTTLLKILCGELSGFEGVRDGGPLRAGILPQFLDFVSGQTGLSYAFAADELLQRLHDEILRLETSGSADNQAILAELFAAYGENGGFELEAEIHRLADEFRLTSEMLARPVETLSGGEKTKIALLRLLLTRPDLLLLDEPTNHLDVETLEWLESYLTRSRTPFLVISHDRRFLDQCCNEIWELKNGSLTIFGGNYSFYRSEKELQLARQLEAAEQATRKISRLKTAASQVRTDADRMENFKPTRSISNSGRICKRDEGSAKALLRTQNKQKAATVLEKRIDRMIEEAEAARPFIEKKRAISFAPCHLKNSTVLRVENLTKRYGENEVLSGFALTVNNGDSLAITGANGSGKTTLLKMLAGYESADSGSISWAPDAVTGYYAQEFEQLDPEATVLDQVLQGDLTRQTRARTILGCLKLESDKVMQQIKTLSVGEKSKTALARLLFIEPDILLLDEPTNHLEIEAREALEDALKEFCGTLILVSHDRWFVDRLARTRIELGG
jgi:ATP-binding cassette subfamily F protein 3